MRRSWPGPGFGTSVEMTSTRGPAWTRADCIVVGVVVDMICVLNCDSRLSFVVGMHALYPSPMLKHADRTHCKVAELGKSPKYLSLLWHGRGHCRPDHIAVVFDGRKRKQPLCQRSADVDICPKEVVVIKVRVLLPVCSSAIPMSAR